MDATAVALDSTRPAGLRRMLAPFEDDSMAAGDTDTVGAAPPTRGFGLGAPRAFSPQEYQRRKRRHIELAMSSARGELSRQQVRELKMLRFELEQHNRAQAETLPSAVVSSLFEQATARHAALADAVEQVLQTVEEIRTARKRSSRQ